MKTIYKHPEIRVREIHLTAFCAGSGVTETTTNSEELTGGSLGAKSCVGYQPFSDDTEE